MRHYKYATGMLQPLPEELHCLVKPELSLDMVADVRIDCDVSVILVSDVISLWCEWQVVISLIITIPFRKAQFIKTDIYGMTNETYETIPLKESLHCKLLLWFIFFRLVS